MPAKLTAVLFTRTTTRTKSRVADALAEGEDESAFVRAAVERELIIRERTAMRLAADARDALAAAASPDRAPLEPYTRPTKGSK